MAIQTDYTKAGVTIPNAYIRLKVLTGSKELNWGGTFEVFASNTEPTPFDTIYFSTIYEDNVNPYVSLYTGLFQTFPNAQNV